MLNNTICHVGRSKRDGAPGPGTGNYPRHSKAEKFFEPSIKKSEKWQSPFEVTANETRSSFESARHSISELEALHKRNKTRPDYSKLSNEELQKRINRMDLERRYASLKGDDSVSRGYENAKNILGVSSDVAAIAVSIATFLAVMNKLR